MILTSSREIVERDGMNGLSARAIAKKIGYSPGTLYNVFKNLDDLLLTIQVALVEEALDALRSVPPGPSAQGHVRALASCYIDFAITNKRLWNLLLQHSTPSNKARNDILTGTLTEMSRLIRTAIAPLMAQCPETEIDETAKAIWYGLHGISAIAVNDKLAHEPATAVAVHATKLVEGMIAYIERQQSQLA
jgi:AcrR family transcriptional regulator